MPRAFGMPKVSLSKVTTAMRRDAVHSACVNQKLSVEEKVSNFASLLQEQRTRLYIRTHRGSTPLHVACISENYFIACYLLLSCGVDVNIKNYFDESPLHWACKTGNLNMIRLLVENGADLDAEDYEGNTPLHWAAETNHCDIMVITYLIQKGSSTISVNSNLETPHELMNKERYKKDKNIAKLLNAKRVRHRLMNQS